MKTSVFIATSLDGFIARPDGAIDWLVEIPPLPDQDYGYAAFMDTIDCIIMGRATFEQVLGFEEWAYGTTRMIVLSTSLHELPASAPPTVELYHGDLAQLVQRLAGEGHRRAYVDGGQTIQSFLLAGLLTDLTITTIPILLGAGLPLFGPLPADVHMRLQSVQGYANGMVQAVYEVISEPR